MVPPIGLMTGADVGILEKKQGRFTFPDRDPVTGLIIDKALEAVAVAASQRQYNHRMCFIFRIIFVGVLFHKLCRHRCGSLY